VGLGAESKAWATKVPVCIRGVMIQPGDIIFCEPAEGIVRIPRNMVDVICDYVVGHAKAEVRVKEAVKDGSTVADAFDKYR
jgi:regulator of RNase E activity RraA